MDSVDEGSGSVPLLFGDPRMASVFGDRRGITIAESTEATVEEVSLFDTEQRAIRATERYDFNFHSPGNVSAVAKDRVAGPMIGLRLP
jgi:HK97 family phage major capsid protein